MCGDDKGIILQSTEEIDWRDSCSGSRAVAMLEALNIFSHAKMDKLIIKSGSQLVINSF